jgi:hypothetical protein
MKKKIISISVAALFLVSACSLFSNFGFRTIKGSGKVITENRVVSGVSQVDVCCGMELYLDQGSRESLEIEADDNYMPEIVTRMVNGRLSIYYKETTNVNYSPSQPVRLYLSAVDVQEVSISGGGKLVTESFSGDQFKIELSGGSEALFGELLIDAVEIVISGGGEVKAGSIEAKRITLELSGSSNADIEFMVSETLTLISSGGGKAAIKGSVTTAGIDLSGGSSLEGQDLMGQETTFSCSGGGSSTIWVEGKLYADLSGGCSLQYYGQPEIISQSLSGGSDLKSLGDH